MADLSQGVSITLAIAIVVVGLVLIFAGGFVAGLLRKLLVNTVLGLAVLVFINLYGSQLGLGIKLPITLLTLLIAAIFGLAGVAVMILLALAGIRI